MNGSDDIHIKVDSALEMITEKAFGFNVGTPDEMWVPKSQIKSACRQNGGDCHKDDLVKNDYVESLEVPRWLADKNGFKEKVD